MPAEAFDRIRSDPRLPPILGLCRVTNAMALGHSAIVAPLKYQSPRVRRDRTAALIYTGAMLAEGLVFAKALGRHFRYLPQYRDGFGKLLGDKQVHEFRTRYLKPLRDKVTFHFDVKVIANVIASMRFAEYVLASGRGKIAGQIYFDLADDVVTCLLVGPYETDAQFLGRLKEFMTGTANLYERFMRAAHHLVPAALAELGARRRFRRGPTRKWS